MEDKKNIWYNRGAMGLFLLMLIFFTVVLGFVFFSDPSIKNTDDLIFNFFEINNMFSRIIVFVFLGFLWSFYFLYLMAKSGKKIKIKNYPLLKKIYKIDLIPYDNVLVKRDMQIDKNYFFRDLPCNRDLLLAYWISFQYKITDKPQDFIGAVLLKLIKDNDIKVIERDSDGYYLDMNKIIKCEYEHEYMLVDILKSATVNGILKEKEFKKWCTSNYRSLSSWHSYSLKVEEERLLNQGLIKKVRVDTDAMFGALQTSSSVLIESDELRSIAKNLIGLKQYLLDFSLIKEKKIIEVHMWEYYLIYAKTFGIADRVKKEFKDIYPDFIDLFDNLTVQLVLDKNGYVDIR